MSQSALPTLLRLRHAAREESHTALRRAEDEREAQAKRLADLRAATVAARAALEAADTLALSSYHEFRARQEVQERREIARLQQREREVDLKRAQHHGRVRDELALEKFMERRAAEEEREEARRDQERMDELGRRKERSA